MAQFTIPGPPKFNPEDFGLTGMIGKLAQGLIGTPEEQIMGLSGPMGIGAIAGKGAKALSTQVIHPRIARLVEKTKGTKFPVGLDDATSFMNFQFKNLEPLARSFGKSVDDLIDLFVGGVNKIINNEGKFLRARRGPMQFEPNVPFKEALERLQEGTNVKITNEAATALHRFVSDDLGAIAARRN